VSARFLRRQHRNYRLFFAADAWIRAHVAPPGAMVLAGLLVTAVLGVDTNITLSHQVFALLLLLAAASALAAWGARPRVEVTRLLPRHATVGVPVRYRIEVRNPSRRPWADLTLAERWPDPRPPLQEFLRRREPGEEKRNWVDRFYAFHRWMWLVERRRRAEGGGARIERLPPRGRVEADATMTPLRRGVVMLASVAVGAPDLFGLFRGVRTAAAPGRILVLPRRYPVPRIDLPGRSARYQPGGVALASSVGESGEFVALRDYRPGDPPRHIHWRSWARAGRPIVKEFQNEFFVRHALVLDTFAPDDREDVFEEAVSVAASFAFSLPEQDSLLDLLFVGPQAYCFTAGRGLAHAEQMLAVLAAVAPCEDTPFETLARLVATHAAKVSGAICVLTAWDEPRRRMVESLTALGVPSRVYVIGRAGERPPAAAGDASIRHLECGRIAEGLAAP